MYTVYVLQHSHIDVGYFYARDTWTFSMKINGLPCSLSCNQSNKPATFMTERRMHIYAYIYTV